MKGSSSFAVGVKLICQRNVPVSPIEDSAEYCSLAIWKMSKLVSPDDYAIKVPRDTAPGMAKLSGARSKV